MSITHRIIGVVNILVIILICIWILSLLLGEANYYSIQLFCKSFFGKFIIISLCWTFSFHTLNELRHLAWDLGYGFDLKASKITGIIAIVGSFVLAGLIFYAGKNII